MKILQISDLALPHVGGIEKVVWKYSSLLVSRGHKVKILTSRIPNTPSYQIIDGVEFRRVPRYLLTLPSYYTADFDVIHTHSYFSFISLGLEKKMRKSVILKHVHSVYGSELHEFTGWSFSRIFSKMEKYLLSTDCSGIIVPSNYTKSRLVELGVKGEIHVLPHGVEYTNYPSRENARERLGIPKNAVVVGFIGRISRGKGPQDIALVWAEIKKRVPNAILIFVGPEPRVSISGIKGNMEEVKRILKESKSLSSVIFAGMVDENMMPYYISSFDLLVSPSINEGFGMSILNSMAAGVPVVAYRNTAIPEMVGNAGILVETGNIQALRDSIISILTDSNLLMEYSSRARERASSYSWDKTIDSLINIYSHYL